jgi:hypothetical protein
LASILQTSAKESKQNPAKPEIKYKTLRLHKEENKMKTINTVNAAVIAMAAAEAGIRENEKYNAYLIEAEGSIAEMVLETEWNLTTCYIDTETGEVLGIMAVAKSSDELIRELREVSAASVSAAYSGRYNKAA